MTTLRADRRCRAKVTPDPATRRRIAALDGEHDMAWLLGSEHLECDLEAGHADRHGRMVQTTDAATDREHWLRWTGTGAPVLEVLPVCPGQDQTGEVLCELYAAHSGAHSGLDEWWF